MTVNVVSKTSGIPTQSAVITDNQVALAMVTLVNGTATYTTVRAPSVALAGMPAGSYTAPVGGRLNLSAEGRLSMEGTSTLAGAVMSLSECIGRAVTITSRSLAEVLTMATSNPRRFVGNRGVLQIGARADPTPF